MNGADNSYRNARGSGFHASVVIVLSLLARRATVVWLISPIRDSRLAEKRLPRVRSRRRATAGRTCRSAHDRHQIGERFLAGALLQPLDVIGVTDDAALDQVAGLVRDHVEVLAERVAALARTAALVAALDVARP